MRKFFAKSEDNNVLIFVDEKKRAVALGCGTLDEALGMACGDMEDCRTAEEVASECDKSAEDVFDWNPDEWEETDEILKKYVIFDEINHGDCFTEILDVKTDEEAVMVAEREWKRKTKNDQESRTQFDISLVNVTESGDVDFDRTPLKEWVSNGQILNKYCVEYAYGKDFESVKKWNTMCGWEQIEADDAEKAAEEAWDGLDEEEQKDSKGDPVLFRVYHLVPDGFGRLSVKQ